MNIFIYYILIWISFFFLSSVVVFFCFRCYKILVLFESFEDILICRYNDEGMCIYVVNVLFFNNKFWWE